MEVLKKYCGESKVTPTITFMMTYHLNFAFLNMI